MFEVARFQSVPLSVRECRHWLARCLDGEVDPAVSVDAQLCLSELAANAVRHAERPFRVEVLGGSSSLRVSVHDDSTDAPVRRDVDVASPGGRGLSIVEAVALQWGWAFDRMAGRTSGSKSGQRRCIASKLLAPRWRTRARRRFRPSVIGSSSQPVEGRRSW